MPRNDILTRRMAKLVAQTFALSEEVVYQRFMELGSIDATITELEEPNRTFNKE
ncbi:MAG: hypothetical protein AABY22_29660 [Nanoarchaeota archaeon]